MNAEVSLETIEAAEAAQLLEAQRLRRLEKARKAAEEKARAEAETVALLPRAQCADVAVKAIMNGEKVSLDFESENGEERHLDVFTRGPRMTKTDTLAMREMINAAGRNALEVAIAEGMNGLINLFKPGKSTCLSDKTFMQLIRSLESMESGMDTMTARSYKILLPLYKLLNRRAK